MNLCVSVTERLKRFMSPTSSNHLRALTQDMRSFMSAYTLPQSKRQWTANNNSDNGSYPKRSSPVGLVVTKMTKIVIGVLVLEVTVRAALNPGGVNVEGTEWERVGVDSKDRQER
jgi:hypothetical protein